MRDLDAALVEPHLKPGGHVAEPGVAVKRPAIETDGGVEPPQQRFAFAVNRVIDLHVGVGSLAVALDGGDDRLEPLVEALSRAGRHLEDPRVRKFAFEGGAQHGDPRRLDDIALVDDEDRCLLELLVIQVVHLT